MTAYCKITPKAKRVKYDIPTGFQQVRLWLEHFFTHFPETNADKKQLASESLFPIFTKMYVLDHNVSFFVSSFRFKTNAIISL